MTRSGTIASCIVRVSFAGVGIVAIVIDYAAIGFDYARCMFQVGPGREPDLPTRRRGLFSRQYWKYSPDFVTVGRLLLTAPKVPYDWVEPLYPHPLFETTRIVGATNGSAIISLY